MKKLWVLLIAVSLVSTATFAQDTKQHDKTEWEKKIKDELKLTPDQTVKYDALSKEYSSKMDEALKDASLTDEAKKEKKMALKKEKETKLFEFLTPEQQAKYKEIIEKKKKEVAKTGS